MRLVDSHCHLNMIEGADTRAGLDAILAAAADNGVQAMLCVSVDMETYPRVREIAAQYDHVYASVGVHPNHGTGREPSIKELVERAADPKVVAIGETGLDYYRSTEGGDVQQQRFRNHIRAARQAHRPLIVHTREARADTLRILREEGAAEAGGVMHCFTEDWDTASQALALGFYISFSGIVTFKSATELQEVARRVPLDRMLIETDSPYLAPVPYRGKPNQPAYVRRVAEFIAQLRGTGADALAEQTANNFDTLFLKGKTQ